MSDYADKLKDWRYPLWEEEPPNSGFWLFRQNGTVVGEAYPIERQSGQRFKWHCKTSDWRDTNATSIEQAKAECEANWWKEEWHEATGHNR